MSEENLIWHYTDSKGLLGIIESNRLHASSALMMNDASEVRYGIEMLKETWVAGKSFLLERAATRVTPEHASTYENFRWSNDVASEYLEEVLDDLEDSFVNNEVFVLSASTEEDNLSLWRAYGSDQGYAIGMRADSLGVVPRLQRTAAETVASSYNLLGGYIGWDEVLYSTVERKQRIATFLENVCIFGAYRAHEDPSSPDTWSGLARMILAREALLYKHDGFKDEREVRIAISLTNPNEYTYFRPSRLGLRPYIELAARGDEGVEVDSNGLKSFTLDIEGRSLLPIAKVVVGPTRYPRSARHGLQQVLETYGFNTVTVKNSDVPFR